VRRGASETSRSSGIQRVRAYERGQSGLDPRSKAVFVLVTPPSIGERNIVMSARACVCVCVCVCSSVCLSVCPWSYLRNYTSTVHQISCARYLWALSSSGDVVIRYVLPVYG